jgi:GDP-mannose 6-dehydrogenase
LGHSVTGVDKNPSKVEMLASGRSPILEARVDELVKAGHQAHRLHATTDAVQAVCESDVSFVCVGTPSSPHGKLDLTHIQEVCREIGQGLARKSTQHLVVIRSTVLPGTTQSIVIPILEAASGKRAGRDFAVCYNPEFTREGSAVEDFLEPPCTILGADDPNNLMPLREIYCGIPGRKFDTSLSVAEMVKYASNSFHALKVSFANEIGTLCKNLGVDTENVMEIFVSDTILNISAAYLSPGFAFGGSCLPKDLRALAYRAKELDLKLPLIEAVLPSNHQHIDRTAEAIMRTGKRKVGMLGLSFKSGTDDLRESPHVHLIKYLLGEGFQVQIWDQYVSLGRVIGANLQFIEQAIPHIGSLLVSSLEDVVNGAEVVVVGTREAEKSGLTAFLRPGQVVIDLVNLQKSRRPDGVATYEGICW